MMKNVLLLDEHILVREGMASLIQRADGLCVCCQASKVEEATVLLQKHDHALIIADYELQGVSGLTLIKTLRHHYRTIPILIVSSREEPLFASRALRAGARGYIRKRDTGSMLIQAIRAVLAGGVYVCDAVRDYFANTVDVNVTEEGPSELELLSDREMEVMRLIGMGLGSTEIAHTLEIRPKTVETYRMRIKKKLYLSSGMALTRRAMEWMLNTETLSFPTPQEKISFENVSRFAPSSRVRCTESQIVTS